MSPQKNRVICGMICDAAAEAANSLAAGTCGNRTARVRSNSASGSVGLVAQPAPEHEAVPLLLHHQLARRVGLGADELAAPDIAVRPHVDSPPACPARACRECTRGRSRDRPSGSCRCRRCARSATCAAWPAVRPAVSLANGGVGEEYMWATEYLKLKSKRAGIVLDASRIVREPVWWKRWMRRIERPGCSSSRRECLRHRSSTASPRWRTRPCWFCMFSPAVMPMPGQQRIG